jgi:uncharacterized membrane protein
MTPSFQIGVVALLLASLIWAATLVAAPYIVSRVSEDAPALRAAAVVYALGSFICHQRRERSFRLSGVQVPVCARCEGLYLGAPFGIAWLIALRRRYRRAIASRRTWQRIIIMASILTLMTLVWEWMTGEMTSGVVRAATGGVLGVAVAAAVTAVAVGDLR